MSSVPGYLGHQSLLQKNHFLCSSLPVQCSESNHEINIEKVFSGLTKNIFWYVMMLNQCWEIFSWYFINIEKAFSGLMKNICWCVLIFTDIVKVSLLAAPCANCALVTLSKSDLQLFILKLHFCYLTLLLKENISTGRCFSRDALKKESSWR